ncbi:MAG: PP2C family protein-serine/threonine phosphatase [Syntrophobacteraceae bacterium]
MKAAFRSDPGRKRANNEDCVFSDVGAGIFILADGMGGHQAGEVASAIAVQEAYAHLKEKASPRAVADYRECLRGAFAKAHDTVRQTALGDKALTGMGTTLVLALVRDGIAYIGSIGDSRAYSVRNVIVQLTKDQTVGAMLAARKNLEQNYIDSVYRHMLTQAVGIGNDLKPELIELSLKEEDILLLCSDGLTNMLSDEEIKTVCALCRKDVDCIVDSLVNAANDKGGFDNISLIAIKF